MRLCILLGREREVIGRGDHALTTTTMCKFRIFLIFFACRFYRCRDMVSMPFFIHVVLRVYYWAGNRHIMNCRVVRVKYSGGEQEVIGRGDPALTTTMCKFHNFFDFFYRCRDMVSMPFLSISFFAFVIGWGTVTL